MLFSALLSGTRELGPVGRSCPVEGVNPSEPVVGGGVCLRWCAGAAGGPGPMGQQSCLQRRLQHQHRDGHCAGGAHSTGAGVGRARQARGRVCRTPAPAQSFGPGSGSTPSIRTAPRLLGMGVLVKVTGMDPSLRQAEVQSHTKDCHPSLLLDVLCGPGGAKSL